MKLNMVFTIILSFMFLVFTSRAQAACANPAGVAGDMVFNSDYAVMQWCDGTDWNGFPKTAPLTGPSAEGPGCSSPTGKAGDMVYNSDFKVLQWCDGNNWFGLPSTGGGSAPCTNPAGDPGDVLYNSDHKLMQWCNGQNWWGVPLPKVPLGFFVLTSGSYTGDLGGLSGANTTCLNELTSNNWKGKTAAVTLTAANVRAWLCSSAGCQNLTSGVLYKTALAGDNTKGGNYLYSDYLGRGPFEDATSNKWNGNNYFGVTTKYWSGRAAMSQTYDGVAWEDQVFSLNQVANTCSDWTSTATNGQYGETDPFWDENQWSAYYSICSAAAHRLICIVDPVDTKDRSPANPQFTDIVNAEASTTHTTTGTVSGITTEVTAIINNIDMLNTANWRGEIRNITTASAWGNRVVVKNGDTIELRMIADSALGTTKKLAISIGDQQFIWSITTRPPNPQGKVGYFALTKTTYSGNMGGLAGANAACLEEIQSQLWYQKGKLSVSATNVRALLCDGASCNNFQANTKYEFTGLGTSPFGGSGGAFFYTNASGHAPNVPGAWGNAGTVTKYVYWGSDNWWTGRGAGTAVSMSATTSGQHCSNWGSTAGNGTIGNATSVGTGRWGGTNTGCSNLRQLACVLDPPATGFGFDDVNNALANTLVTKSFTFTALTAAVSAVVTSGTAEIRKNAGAWGTSIASLGNGDTIEVRMQSSVLGNAAQISHLTVGDAKIDWIVRTKDDSAVSEQKIQPGTGTGFGSKVARYKNTMAVAAGGSLINIYTYSAGSWTLAASKTTSFAGITSLAIDDDTLVVGYENYNPVPPPPYYPGGIAIWQKGATWSDATQLIIPSPDNIAYTYFGAVVATSGNYVVGAGKTGKLYIYENTGSGWASATVTARTTVKNIYYSSNKTMVMRGNTLAIGTHPVNAVGQIEVIENTGSGWGMGAASVNIIMGSDVISNDNFGVQLDLSEDGSTIVTSAVERQKTLSNGQTSWQHGAAYIFEKIGNWSLTTQTQISLPTVRPAVRFGSSVAISGNIVGIGSSQAMGDGAVYLYKKTSTWAAAAVSAPTLLMQHLTASNSGYIFDTFGTSLSLCGSVIVTGAPYSSEVALDRGYVYSHDISTYTGGQTCL